jgi:hypothetical protein
MVFRRGEWDKEDPRDVDATTGKEAAQIVCGPEPLGEAGHHGSCGPKYDAMINHKKYFYQRQ